MACIISHRQRKHLLISQSQNPHMKNGLSSLGFSALHNLKVFETTIKTRKPTSSSDNYLNSCLQTQQKILISSYRNMFAVCTVVLLCFMSGSHSAPLDCDGLLRPSDQLDPSHLQGRRAMVAGSISHLPFMERLNRSHSATVDFSSNSSETNTFSRSRRMDDECLHVSYSISLNGCSFTFDNVTTTFVHTSCHDCVLLSFDVESGKRTHVYLFSRRRELEQEEMEEFRRQMECLNMPPPAVMDPTKELCPEEASEAAAQTEDKTEGQKD